VEELRIQVRMIEGINSRNENLRRDIGIAAYKLGKRERALEW
jgi:hypothetical protein